MALATQPLRDEHAGLFPHVELLRTTGELVAKGDLAAVSNALDEVLAFLTGDLIPHAMAEDRALYPVVARVMGAPAATATMSRDHTEVGRLVGELAELRAGMGGRQLRIDEQESLRRVLYGLYALVGLHFAKEEEIYLPLLDAALAEGEAKEMFETMEAAAGEARRSQPR